MKKIILIVACAFLSTSSFSQTFINTAPLGETWYKINTRGRFLMKISATGDYAVHDILVYSVSGNWNTAEYTIVSEYNYNHKQIKIDWGYVGNGADRHLVLRSMPTPNAAYARGFTIRDVSDPNRNFELEIVSDPTTITEINPHNKIYVSEHTGMVGIGTTSPSEKLEVEGKLRWGTNPTTSWGEGLLSMNSGWNSGSYPTIGSIGGTSGSLIMLHNPDVPFRTDNTASGYTGRAGIRMAIEKNASKYWDMGLAGDFFHIYRSGGQGEFLRITNQGNVGIGTTTPDYKLDVLGTIRAEEVKVATGWSDFVFEPDYDLKSLDQVEEFINENGHLPDIPSAEEVAENGISLGEMGAKLLQKVEELTLYVIELKKENDAESEKLKSESEKNAKLTTELNELKAMVEALMNEK